MKLYHYSNNKIKDTLKVNFYGNNNFTANDLKCTTLKRLFFYTNKNDCEYYFKNNHFCYTANVNKKSFYNLKTDKNRILKKFNSIGKVLRHLKNQGYKGIIYNTGNLSIVNLFYNVKVDNFINLKKRSVKNDY